MKWLTMAWCSVVLTASSVHATEQTGLFSYSNTPVFTSQPDFKSLRGEKTLMVFIEPDCPWCLKQVRLLNALLPECQRWQFIGIAFRGSMTGIRAAIEQYRPKFAVYKASYQLEQVLESAQGTPFLLFTDTEGHPIWLARGFQSRQRLASLLAEKWQDNCVLSPK